MPPSCPCVRLRSSTHAPGRPSSRIRASSAPDRYGPQSSRRPSRSIQALGTCLTFMPLAGPRRRKTARRVPSSGVRIRGSLQPPGMRRQLMGVLLLLVLSLLPGSGDVQTDIRVAPVPRRRSRFDGPPVLFGVPNLQNGPPVEPPVGPPVPRPLPGPCSQFINLRMIHPVHRDRFSLFTFQEVAVVDDASARPVATPARRHSPAKILVRVQLRRRHLDRARPRVHHVNAGSSTETPSRTRRIPRPASKRRPEAAPGGATDPGRMRRADPRRCRNGCAGSVHRCTCGSPPVRRRATGRGRRPAGRAP